MRKFIILLSLLALLWPATASAQTGGERGTLIRIDSDAVVPAGESIENVVVISGNAIIEGTVTDALLVIDGDATISGRVNGDVTVISGTINLLGGSTVENVHSFRSTVVRDPGATVTGDVNESDLSGFWAVLGVFSILIWLGFTIAAIVAGIIFALIGGRQLAAAGSVMTGNAAGSIVGAVFIWIGVPILAVIAMITVVGLPLGLGLLIFLLPTLAFLGYLVAATRVGSMITGALNRESTGRPILAVVLGVIILQLLMLIPILGALIVLFAALWGAGALAFVAYRAAGGRELTLSHQEPAA